MKILWFTNTPSLYDQGKHHYHGGGWIESLEELLGAREGIELGISFFHATDCKKVFRNKTTYYPIKRKNKNVHPLRKLKRNWSGEVDFPDLKLNVEEIISDFKPDVTHVFGTEGEFSQINSYVKSPVVYHIQGLINPVLNTYLPVNQSNFNFHLNRNYIANTIKGNNPAFDFKRFKNQAKREKKVLELTNFVMGRTHWDKMITKLYNPKVQYFHLDEVLRPNFYGVNQKSELKSNRTFQIISTLSPTVYKGIDVVLKTAQKLKELTNIDFQWEIIGLDKNAPLLKHFEKTEKINHQEVNIICRGRKHPKELVELLQKANVYVHPSYIDNSPNSVCEAQILGLPVIACDVGGVSSLIKHEVTGFLVPSNGVFEFVHYLKILNENKHLGNTIGKHAKEIAEIRHNREKIVRNLLNIYSHLNN